MNLSSKQLTDYENSVLLKGMNYCVTPKSLPIKEIVANVEQAIKPLPKEQADTIRAKVSLTLQNAKIPKDNLSKQERISLTKLKKDETVMILPADKGRTTVILDKDDYIKKCYEHINNGPYKLLKRDPTEIIKRETRSILLALNKEGFIPDMLYYRLRPSDTPPPRFYGLPKVHKQGIPIRPIVSCTGTPLYNLSKHIASILSNYTKSDHCKNSQEFSQYIRNLTIEEDECMVSFDVVSLYTNVPISDTLDIIRELLLNDDEYENKTHIPIDKLMSLIEIVLTKTWYLFDGKYFSQTDGVAMGGPTSSVVAEIYMQAHENTALTTADHAPRVWKRFVDDVFLIIKRSHLEQFHKHINALHPKIQFTVEYEKDDSIPFLDTLVCRNEGKLSVTVYRKPTHTDQYLNFTSNHQMSCKESVVSSLLDRAINIVSEERDRQKELSHVKNALQANGYKQQMINKVKHKIINRTDREQDLEDETVATVFMPYIPETSNVLRRVLHDFKIRSVFHSKNTLRSVLSKPKDKIGMESQSNIVYEIPCKDCDSVYVGETKRQFKTRVKEHMTAVRNCDIDKYEIAEHSWKNDHVIDWDNKKIIDRESGWTARKVKETIHSFNKSNRINSISYQLPEIWFPAIRKTNF